MIARFKYVDKLFKHVPRGRGHSDDKLIFAMAQVELFNLAQAIAYGAEPKIQFALDDARRAFMAEVREHLADKPATLIVKKSRVAFWYDFLISPEVSNDFSLKGITISKDVCYDLERAHKKQVELVRWTTS